jgi:uncharacterized protein (TIGR02270 family)
LDAGAAFAAAVVALCDPSAGRWTRVLTLAEETQSSFGAIVSAFGWHEIDAVEALLSDLTASSSARERALGIAGLASHRRSPKGGLSRMLRDEHPAVRATAAKASGELGEIEHAGALGELLTDTAIGVRFNAARALARFGEPRQNVQSTLLALSESGGPVADRAAAAFVRLAPRQGASLFRRWVRADPSRRRALVVAETLGSIEVVEDLLPWMQDNGIARSAGDVFRTITGADLRLCGLTRPRPDQAPGEPTDDPDDDAVDLPSDYELPFPDAGLIAAWWRRERERFVAGARYLDGNVVGFCDGTADGEHVDTLRTMILSARPRHQTLAASAHAQLEPHVPSVETHAFATARQMRAR